MKSAGPRRITGRASSDFYAMNYREDAELATSRDLPDCTFAPFSRHFPTDAELHPPDRPLRPQAPEYHDRGRTKHMQVETTRKLFTVDEYYRMAEVGILRPTDRVELIDGEIFEMSPIGSRHLGCVNRANRLFTSALGNRVVVSIQNPLQLSNYTEPEPDIVLLKPRLDEYAAKKPLAEDALLVVEVAETTFAFDSKVKLPRYAKKGVPEVWIEHLTEDALLVYRNPAGNRYATELALRSRDSVSPIAFPDAVFAIDQLLV